MAMKDGRIRVVVLKIGRLLFLVEIKRLRWIAVNNAEKNSRPCEGSANSFSPQPSVRATLNRFSKSSPSI